ncbi:MAG: lactate utilization protein C [Rubrivivax sp.]|nr:lactate utilization protein C [Rubrivivax sp.]
MPSPDTRTARASILGRLRASAPAVPLAMPDLLPYLNGPHGHGSLGPRVDPSTLLAPFETAALSWRADVLHARPADWPRVVRQALDQRACTRVAIGAASPLQPGLDAALAGLQVRRFDQPLEQWKGELFDAIDAGVTATEGGIADTGTLVLRPGAHEPRTLSLVPAVHVAVLLASRLYAGLPAALSALSPPDDMPTNLLLVSGPSKTADIQQTLAYGAHGPKELVIVLVDDLNNEGVPQS